MGAVTGKSGRSRWPAPRLTVAQLQDALAGLADLPPARRAAAADQLVEAARRTLLWERGQALTDARDDGVEDPQLARELGVSRRRSPGCSPTMPARSPPSSGRPPACARSTAAGPPSSSPAD